MPSSSGLKQRGVGTLLLILSLTLCGFVLFSSRVNEAGPAAWRGYRVLLVLDSVPEEQVLAALKSAGFSQVLSKSAQPVLVSNWSKTETFSLAEVPDRLAPDDPRLDAYLSKLSLWFEGKAWGKPCSVYYIKNPALLASAAGMDAEISQALQAFQGSFFLPSSMEVSKNRGFPYLPFALALATLLSFAVLSALMGQRESFTLKDILSYKIGSLSRGRLLARLVLLFPLIILSTRGMAPAAIAVIGGLWSSELLDILDLPLAELRRSGFPQALKTLKCQPRPSWVFPVLVILSLYLARLFFIPALAAFLASVLLEAAFVLLARESDIRFIPLPIAVRSKLKLSAQERLRLIIVCATIVLWLAARLSGPGLVPSTILEDDRYSFPTPIKEEAALRPEPQEARILAQKEGSDILPGIASYLQHCAFQEALPYLQIGQRRSDPFAPLSLPESDSSQLNLQFDGAWARNIYAKIPSLSLEAMLLSQGSSVSAKPGDGSMGGASPLAPIEGLLYIFLLIPPLGRIVGSLRPSRKTTGGEIRQEA